MSDSNQEVLEATIKEQRRQLRWAWLNIGEGCRCIFDDEDNKIVEDSHCYIHGIYVEKDLFRELALSAPASDTGRGAWKWSTPNDAR